MGRKKNQEKENRKRGREAKARLGQGQQTAKNKRGGDREERKADREEKKAINQTNEASRRNEMPEKGRNINKQEDRRGPRLKVADEPIIDEGLQNPQTGHLGPLSALLPYGSDEKEDNQGDEIGAETEGQGKEQNARDGAGDFTATSPDRKCSICRDLQIDPCPFQSIYRTLGSNPSKAIRIPSSEEKKGSPGEEIDNEAKGEKGEQGARNSTESQVDPSPNNKYSHCKFLPSTTCPIHSPDGTLGRGS